MLELGSIVLLGKVYGFTGIVVDIVDIVKECDFRELIDFSIAVIIVIIYSRAFSISLMVLSVLAESFLISVWILSTVTLTPILTCSSLTETVSR